MLPAEGWEGVQPEAKLTAEVPDSLGGVGFSWKTLLSPRISVIYLFTYFAVLEIKPDPCLNARQASLTEPPHPKDRPLPFDVVSF